MNKLRRTWVVDEIIPLEPLLKGACLDARRQVRAVFKGPIQVCRSAAELADEQLPDHYAGWAAERLLSWSKFNRFRDLPRCERTWTRLFELMIEREWRPLVDWLRPEPAAVEQFALQWWER